MTAREPSSASTTGASRRRRRGAIFIADGARAADAAGFNAPRAQPEFLGAQPRRAPLGARRPRRDCVRRDLFVGEAGVVAVLRRTLAAGCARPREPRELRGAGSRRRASTDELGDLAAHCTPRSRRATWRYSDELDARGSAPAARATYSSPARDDGRHHADAAASVARCDAARGARMARSGLAARKSSSPIA